MFNYNDEKFWYVLNHFVFDNKYGLIVLAIIIIGLIWLTLS